MPIASSCLSVAWTSWNLVSFMLLVLDCEGLASFGIGEEHVTTHLLLDELGEEKASLRFRPRFPSPSLSARTDCQQCVARSSGNY